MVGPEGTSALLVRPGRAAEIADALRLLFTDPELGARLGANGRARVLEQMTIERMTDEMTRVYGLALRNGSS
jgi:glycosyltransferase involved in cell wall biosynthesis